MAAEKKDEQKGPDRAKLLTVLVPAAGVALVVILVAVIVGLSDTPSGGSSDKGPRPRREKPTDMARLSDGTAPGDDDPGLKELEGGLKYRDIKEGDGAEVPPGARVTVDYTGWLTSGKMFDSSWKGPEPATFGLNQVVPGWQKGIPGMKVGGIRKLVIPPEMGYGERGSPPDIPPNATLVFEVQVLAIK